MILLEDRLDPYPLGKSAFKPLLAQQENLLVPDYLKDLYTNPGLRNFAGQVPLDVRLS